MKNWFKIFSIVTVILTLSVFSSVFATTAEVQINGQIIDFTDSNGNLVKAQLINSRTMVPLRKIFEILGCEIEWNGETQTVFATKGEKEIVLQINNTNAIIKENGVEKTIELDTAPVILNNRTLVPLRFVAESLEKQVGWDSSAYTAIIIDYDYFSDLIKQKNEHFYNIFDSNSKNMSFSITQNYADKSNSSLNTTATLAGKIQKEEEKSIVTLTFSGNDELIKDIISEGWNNVVYEAKYDDNKIHIKSDNEVFQKILNLNVDSDTVFDVHMFELQGEAEDSLSEAIKNLFDVKDNQLNVTTFSEMKLEFNNFLNLFVQNGTKTLNENNLKTSRLDFSEFDNVIYANEMMRTLSFINQTIFRYDIKQEELLYDWNTIQYTVTSENNILVLKLILENEYNEKVEYVVKCNLD